MALVENLQRENLNPIEEAYAMANLVEQFQWTHQEVADAIGKARATVSNLLRLIECPAEVRNLIKQGQLSMGHARALLALPDKQQAKIADIVVLKQLSVRQTEQLVKKTLQENAGQAQGKAHNKAKDTNIQALENNLADLLGAAVNIKHADNNKGKIEIQYNDLDELDGILRQFKLKL
jgi:ParB family chromosome partitioning protein